MHLQKSVQLLGCISNAAALFYRSFACFQCENERKLWGCACGVVNSQIWNICNLQSLSGGKNSAAIGIRFTLISECQSHSRIACTGLPAGNCCHEVETIITWPSYGSASIFNRDIRCPLREAGNSGIFVQWLVIAVCIDKRFHNCAFRACFGAVHVVICSSNGVIVQQILGKSWKSHQKIIFFYYVCRFCSTIVGVKIAVWYGAVGQGVVE